MRKGTKRGSSGIVVNNRRDGQGTSVIFRRRAALSGQWGQHSAAACVSVRGGVFDGIGSGSRVSPAFVLPF